MGWSVSTVIGPPNRAVDHFSALPVDRTATRVVGTSYQASTTARVVNIHMASAAGANARIEQADDTGFTTNVVVLARASPAGGNELPLCAVVGPSKFYRHVQASVALLWTERDL